MINADEKVTIPCDVYCLKSKDFDKIENIPKGIKDTYDVIEISARVSNYIIVGIKGNIKTLVGICPLNRIPKEVLDLCEKETRYIPICCTY